MIKEQPFPENYYAVIFSSKRTDREEGYATMSQSMEDLAKDQPGYLGIESYRNPDGKGVTISYWKSMEHIRQWKQHLEHRDAQNKGRNDWYSYYRVRVCRVEYEYDFNQEKI